MRGVLGILEELLGYGEVVSGFEGERGIAERIRGFMESLGLETRLVEFGCMAWRCRWARLVVDGEEFEAALPFSPYDGEVVTEQAGAKWLKNMERADPTDKQQKSERN